MAAPLITALEIGTTTVKVLMAEVREDGGLMVSGVGESESRGVHKGEIIDFELALGSVRRAMETAEGSARRTIGESLYLTASGGQAASLLHQAGIPVLNEYEEPGGEVTQEDIEHVLEVARKVPIPDDRIRLHTLQQTFEVDGRGGISNPAGLLAHDMKVGMLLIHGRRSTVENLKKILQAVPVHCEDAAFSGFCSALAVLTPEQKRAGAVVIDLGGGTTDFAVYNAGTVRLAGSIAVGGSHVTEDICTGLNINRRQAEALKKASGSAIINAMDGEQSFSVPAEGGFSGRVVRSVTLHTIINARMEETFRLIADQIEAAGLSGVLSAGVLLTGGGSALEGAVDLAQQVFNAPAQIGKMADCVGISTKKEGARFASALGAVRYAADQMVKEPEDTTPLRGWFSKLWGGSRG
ncbi:cell division protein FtsA [Tichowtungia aerotolerans]|uniref:Cell division protein FtsA n=1 Tax=Tichowtungia aerotolerans TaxID=2697043 RepID=A0A6P1MAH0_9BACT|nr:cell division protein FtsA [Tichowtungia aerotolerans]QHI70093.1 cell division protein FtsA [Tichowtungia aerotolerans]